MLNGKVKNKIYALISISVLIILIGSFVVFANFLIEINNLTFNLNEKLIEEKTTISDIDGYNKIKGKIENIPIN